MTRAILEFARTIKPETLAAIPRRVDVPRTNRGCNAFTRDSVITLAAAEYLAIERPQRGDLKRIADKHSIPTNSLYTRLYRDGLATKQQ